MADDPTIEEVSAAKARLRQYDAECEAAMYEAPSCDEDPRAAQHRADLRTLLASHASLEERVEEAKRLMKPFAEAAENLDDGNDFDDDELWEHAAAMGLHVRDLRALAAFVNEKET